MCYTEIDRSSKNVAGVLNKKMSPKTHHLPHDVDIVRINLFELVMLFYLKYITINGGCQIK